MAWVPFFGNHLLWDSPLGACLCRLSQQVGYPTRHDVFHPEPTFVSFTGILETTAQIKFFCREILDVDT